MEKAKLKQDIGTVQRSDTLRGVFHVKGKEETEELGRKIAFIFPEEWTLKNIALEGDSGLGKTSLVRAIREQLDLLEVYRQTRPKTRGGEYEQGVWANTDDEFAFDKWTFRQMDCLYNKLSANTDPEFSSEHRMDNPNGVDCYEHPEHNRADVKYDYTLKFSKAAAGGVMIELHSSPEELANMNFQDFLGETQSENLMMDIPSND